MTNNGLVFCTRWNVVFKTSSEVGFLLVLTLPHFDILLILIAQNILYILYVVQYTPRRSFFYEDKLWQFDHNKQYRSCIISLLLYV